MSKPTEEFIETHVAICHITGKKRYPRHVEHRGRGAFRSRSEASRKRECAKKLWKSCEKIRIAPTPVREEFQESYDKYMAQQPPTHNSEKTR